MTAVKKKPIKPVPSNNNEFDFNVYICRIPSMFKTRTVIVLSKDMQSALSTVPDAMQITRLEGTIIINKVVAKGISDYHDKKKSRKT